MFLRRNFRCSCAQLSKISAEPRTGSTDHGRTLSKGSVVRESVICSREAASRGCLQPAPKLNPKRPTSPTESGPPCGLNDAL
jgi:hypothetical protein